MKKRIISLVLLAVIIFSALSLTSCKVKTPEGIWKKAIQSLAEANTVSMDSEVTLGSNTVKLNISSDRETKKRSYDIHFSEENIVLYTDGNINYYTVEDMNFSVKASDDSEIFREFLGFTLTNSERMIFEDTELENAVVTEADDEKSLEFEVSGEVFKKAFSPDEDIEYSRVKIKTIIDSEDNFKSISISTKAKGKDFYGLPLIGASTEKATLSVKIDNIEYTGDKTPIEPKDISEYPESVMFAKIFPTSVFSLMNSSSMVDSTTKMEMSVLGITMKSETKSNTITQYINGKMFKRTVSDVTEWEDDYMTLEHIDEYYDGESGYLYYSDGYDKYKMEYEETDLPEEEFNEETFKEIKSILSDAVIKDNEITIDLTIEDLRTIIGEDEFEESFGDDIDLKSADLKIVLKDGFIETLSFNFKFEMTVNGMTAEAKAEFESKYYDLRENYEVTAPDGYEEYEDLFN